MRLFSIKIQLVELVLEMNKIIACERTLLFDSTLLMTMRNRLTTIWSGCNHINIFTTNDGVFATGERKNPILAWDFHLNEWLFFKNRNS